MGLLFVAQLGHQAAKGVVVAGGGHEVRVMSNDEAGTPICRLSGLTGSVNALSLSSTEDAMAIVCADSVHIVDLVSCHRSVR